MLPHTMGLSRQSWKTLLTVFVEDGVTSGEVLLDLPRLRGVRYPSQKDSQIFVFSPGIIFSWKLLPIACLEFLEELVDAFGPGAAW